jgi:hypothetical protein
MLRRMANTPVPLHPEAQAIYDRRLRRVRAAVLWLASFVALSLSVSVIFGIYNYTTDKPAKAIFGISDK